MLADDLADAQVMMSGSPITLYFASPAQINGVLPDSASGLTPLTVQNSIGKSTSQYLCRHCRAVDLYPRPIRIGARRGAQGD